MTDCLSLRIKAKHLPVSSVSPKKRPAVKQMTWSHQSNSSLDKDSSASTFVTPVSVAQDVLTLHTLHRWLTHFVAFNDSAIRCTRNLSTLLRSTVTPLQYTCEGYAHVQIKPLICYNDRSHTFHFSTWHVYRTSESETEEWLAQLQNSRPKLPTLSGPLYIIKCVI